MFSGECALISSGTCHTQDRLDAFIYTEREVRRGQLLPRQDVALVFTDVERETRHPVNCLIDIK